jgi:hypothetical protein
MAPTTPDPTTLAPTNVGETFAPTANPTGAPTTSEPTTAAPSDAPTTRCPEDAAGFCAGADCSIPGGHGVAIRYNCQRTCNSCRTQEVIDINDSQASGLSREAGSPNDDSTREVDPGDKDDSDRTAKVVTAVLVSVLAVAVLGAAYLLNSFRASHQLEKPNPPVDLGWDDSVEAAWENKRATVWHQQGSVDGSHFYPEDRVYLDVRPGRGSQLHPDEGGMTAFEPVNLGDSFARAPSAPQHLVGPAKFYPLSSRLNR